MHNATNARQHSALPGKLSPDRSDMMHGDSAAGQTQASGSSSTLG